MARQLNIHPEETCELCGRTFAEGDQIYHSTMFQLFGFKGMDPAVIAHWDCVPKFHREQAESVDRFMDWIEQEYGGKGDAAETPAD